MLSLSKSILHMMIRCIISKHRSDNFITVLKIQICNLQGSRYSSPIGLSTIWVGLISIFAHHCTLNNKHRSLVHKRPSKFIKLVEGWMNAWMNEWSGPSPASAAAPASLKLFHTSHLSLSICIFSVVLTLGNSYHELNDAPPCLCLCCALCQVYPNHP